MLKINIETIPHKKQEYETIGNWKTDGEGKIDIYVSDLGDWKMEALIGIHELVETLLCNNRGIKESDVLAFDLEFEKNRPEGNDDEPGDSPQSPYLKEHQIATAVERLLCSYLDVNWEQYEQKCIDVLNSLD